jgi:hypothetical protein
MFSATEPLASTPLAANGTTKLVNGSAALSQAAQLLAGSGQRKKLVTAGGILVSPAQVLAGNSLTIRVLYGSADLSQGEQILEGNALYTRIVSASGDLNQAAQELLGLGYPFKLQSGTGDLLQEAQTLIGAATVINVTAASGALANAAQRIAAAATKIRILSGAGTLIAAPQTLYGSDVSPIWIKTPRVPNNIYDVSRKITSQPYTTANQYVTIYQVPGYKEVQTNGTIIEYDITGIISAMSATTADGTPQPVSVIIIKLLTEDFDVFPLFPAYTVTTGVENIMPLRDFNLVTGDIIQIKALGAGEVTVNMSILLNTQPLYEVL